jgi:Ca2+:H+ antiporter
MPRWMYFLLICTLLAPILELFHVFPLLIFIIAGLGILPLAALIGTSVEGIAEHTGEQIGGLLFATFGNATELIIGILALSQGLVDVVSASIIGSVLGNLLLVLGIAVCVGSLRHGSLNFATQPAGQYASMLALSIGGLLLPTVAILLAQYTHQPTVTERGVALSDFVAILLLIGYIASILYSVFHIGERNETPQDEVEPLLGARSQAAITRLLAYRQHLVNSAVPGKTGMLHTIDHTVNAILEHETAHSSTTQASEPPSEPADEAQQTSTTIAKAETASATRASHSKPSLWRNIILLTVATAGVAILSEILVSAIEPVTALLHWNPAFVGLIFLPLIGGLPEYFNTISMALNKRIDMVLAASAGSSIQIALLMAPVLVLVSLLTPQRLDLVFSIIELATLGLATFLFSEITRDGKLVWLEGLLLMLLYAMMGGTTFLFG